MLKVAVALGLTPKKLGALRTGVLLRQVLKATGITVLSVDVIIPVLLCGENFITHRTWYQGFRVQPSFVGVQSGF